MTLSLLWTALSRGETASEARIGSSPAMLWILLCEREQEGEVVAKEKMDSQRAKE